MDIFRHLVSLPGWHTHRKIVVFESDDWGSIRIPSQDVFRGLLEKGAINERNPYSRFDSLECKEDFDELFNTLGKFSDKRDHPPVITANVVTGNPDFDSIQDSGFLDFHVESFSKTYDRERSGQALMNKWAEGIRCGYLRPEFHGREHVNVGAWLTALQSGNNEVGLGFKFRTFAVDIPDDKGNYMATYDLEVPETQSYITSSIDDGIRLFEEAFGFRPRTFIAPCYVWNEDVEEALRRNDVWIIQGINYQYKRRNRHIAGRRFHYMGQRNPSKQVYLIRNAFFEPSLYSDLNSVVPDCLNRIRIAFKWGRPAIVGTHRLNFVGSLVPENRSVNLVLMEELLTKITRLWPDVEFMSTDQLGELIMSKDV